MMYRKSAKTWRETPCTAMEMLYKYYQGHREDADEQIRDNFLKIEDYVKELPCEARDGICTVASELCVVCEWRAFLDSVSIGARLIMELQGLT